MAAEPDHKPLLALRDQPLAVIRHTHLLVREVLKELGSYRWQWSQEEEGVTLPGGSGENQTWVSFPSNLDHGPFLMSWRHFLL